MTSKAPQIALLLVALFPALVAACDKFKKNDAADAAASAAPVASSAPPAPTDTPAAVVSASTTPAAHPVAPHVVRLPDGGVVVREGGAPAAPGLPSAIVVPSGLPSAIVIPSQLPSTIVIPSTIPIPPLPSGQKK
jgi:hypothetical protein